MDLTDGLDQGGVGGRSLGDGLKTQVVRSPDVSPEGVVSGGGGGGGGKENKRGCRDLTPTLRSTLTLGTSPRPGRGGEGSGVPGPRPRVTDDIRL